MDTQIRLLLRLYILCALIFVGLTFIHPFPGSFLIKPVPVLIMAYLCWRYLEGRERYLIVLGFIFSAAGDIFLDLDRVAFFKQGLVSFLVTQVLYSIAFLGRRKIDPTKWMAATAVILYAVLMVILLWDSLGDLRIPVMAYILALTVMGVSGALREGPLTGVYLGAFLFVIADSIIAINKFLWPFELSLTVILTVYFSGQFFIGRGVLLQHKDH